MIVHPVELACRVCSGREPRAAVIVGEFPDSHLVSFKPHPRSGYVWATRGNGVYAVSDRGCPCRGFVSHGHCVHSLALQIAGGIVGVQRLFEAYRRLVEAQDAYAVERMGQAAIGRAA